LLQEITFPIIRSEKGSFNRYQREQRNKISNTERKKIIMEGLITAESYDHTGVVVRDARASADSWSRKLGAGPWRFTDTGRLLLAHGYIGETQYELLQPIEGVDSLWAAFLAEHGEGLHHISHNVKNVEEATAKLLEDGGQIVVYDGKPIAKPGRMAYVDIGGPGSVIIELMKMPDK
jgi:catechol 2,3-dioxygenase-like lactoylglutathione lyase family enzyme